MTLTTIDSLGSVEYKSYASLDEANGVLDVDPTRRVAWDALEDEDKYRFLIAATQRLDILPWRGKKAGGATQETAWPREGVTYADGTTIADDAIPLELERATALLAGSINIRPSQAEQGGLSSDISSIKAGSVDIEFANPERRDTPATALQDETAYQLIRQWLVGQTGTIAGAIASGTDVCSEWTDKDRYGFRHGF